MSIASEKRNPVDAFVQTALDAVGNVCWAQEQGEKVLRAYLELGRGTREETREIAQKVAGQIRQNQEEMQRWVRSTVEMSMAAFRPATVAQFEELNRKVEELTRKVEELSKRK